MAAKKKKKKAVVLSSDEEEEDDDSDASGAEDMDYGLKQACKQGESRTEQLVPFHTP